MLIYLEDSTIFRGIYTKLPVFSLYLKKHTYILCISLVDIQTSSCLFLQVLASQMLQKRHRYISKQDELWEQTMTLEFGFNLTSFQYSFP